VQAKFAARLASVVQEIFGQSKNVNRNSIVSSLLIGLLVFAVVWFFGFNYVFHTKKQLTGIVRFFGVAVKRIARVIKELKRKTFHLFGLVIPAIYYFGLKFVPGFDKRTAILIMGAFTEVYWFMELLRLMFPSVKNFFKVASGGLLRQKEENRITGIGFLLLGNFTIISMFPELATITAMLYLILGDLIAALVGISFGKVKIYGKKSLEGTLAMFVTCFAVGLAVLWRLPFFEYMAFIGASVACLIELFDPLGIDDNFSIPVSGALAIQLAAWRINYMVHQANQSPTWVNLSLK